MGKRGRVGEDGRGAAPRAPSSRGPASTDPRPWGIPALIAAVGLAAWLSCTPVLDSDVWWHLATGDRILAGSGIPRTDPFTYTALGRPWVTHEWLSEVLFSLLYRLGGIKLLVVFKALLAGLAVALSCMAGLVGSRSRSRILGAAVGALLAAPLISLRAFVRPHMLTALFLGGLLLLLRMEATTGRRLWRWLLVPLFLVWANVHSGFVLGMLLLGLSWGGGWLDERLSGAGHAGADPRPAGPPSSVWRDRGLALLLCLAATLVNPNFINAHLYPFRLVASEEVRGGIVELRSLFHPAYRGALFRMDFAAGIGVAAILMVAARRRLNWALALPGIAFALLAVASIRGLSEFSVILPALIAVHAETSGRNPWSGRRWMVPSVAVAVLVLAGACGWMAFARGVPVGAGSNQRLGTALEPGSRPVAAARFLKEERPAGRVFNLLSYGGYLIHALGPETKVYIDGRLDVFPTGFLGAYNRMVETGAGWQETVDKYGITIAIVNYIPNAERDRGLRARLRTDPSWACVLAGDYTLVYARRVPENESILRRYAIPFDPSARDRDFVGDFTRRADPRQIQSALASLDAMHRVAPEEIAPLLFAGQVLDRVGRSAEAVPFARRALRLDPSSNPIRLFLGETLLRADSTDAARRLFESILDHSPDDAEALSQLALIERSQGRLPEALRLLEKAASRNPADAAVQVRLGAVLAESGRIDEGRRHMERALSLSPGDPFVIQNLRALEALEAQGRTRGIR
jgi:Flp pilus assembly protein TadD